MIPEPLIVALQFLTRLPVGALRDPNPRQLGLSLLYYPLVGALIGAALWVIAWLGAGLAGAALAALLLVVLTMASGALHLEGLADSSDGWAASHGNPQRALDVMRDPHCGPLALTVVAVVVVCKFAALYALVVSEALNAVPVGAPHGALIAAPMLGRAAVIALYAATPYVRRGGIGEQLAHNLPKQYTAPVLFVCGLATLLLCGAVTGLALLALAAAAWYGARRLMVRIIGGATGDTTGATIELVETAVLLGAALLVA